MLIRILLPLALLTAGCSATAQEVRDPLGCNRSDSSVHLVAEIVRSDEGISVRISFQNQGDLGVRLINLGTGAYRRWEIDPESIPEPTDSPTGWDGRLSIEYEGTHMKIVWAPVTVGDYVAPGAELTGFGFSLDAGATLPANLPFQAMFADGTCVWSHLAIAEESPGDP